MPYEWKGCGKKNRNERRKIVYENELNHLNFKKKRKYGKIKVYIFNKRKTVFHTDKNEAKRNSSCRKKLQCKKRAMGTRMNRNHSFYHHILSGAKIHEDFRWMGCTASEHSTDSQTWFLTKKILSFNPSPVPQYPRKRIQNNLKEKCNWKIYCTIYLRIMCMYVYMFKP